jgi:hypothetical protein
MHRSSSQKELDGLLAFIPVSEVAGAHVESTAVANVPFDFVVGEMLLPAGRYDLGDTDVPGLVALRHNGCEYPAALVQEIRSRRERAELLFYRQENLYFLAQLLAGESSVAGRPE